MLKTAPYMNGKAALRRVMPAWAMMTLIVAAGDMSAAEKPLKKKLQIVFLLGQGDLSGAAELSTAWYRVLDIDRLL